MTRLAPLAAVCALAVAGCAGQPPPTTVPAAPGMGFGVLASTCDPARAAAERTAGIETVTVELAWDRLEPGPGQFDPHYVADLSRKVETCRAAGLDVVLGLGLQYPPGWVRELPSARYVNQFGNPSVLGEVDLVFSGAVRDAVSGYLAHIGSTVGWAQFSGVRIGTNRTGELGYPGPSDGDDEGDHDFWAFGEAAQSGTGLAEGMSVSPMPGWIPGMADWNGAAVDTTGVTSWFRWYADSLVGSLAWQIGELRELGYGGEFLLPVPGRGVLPADLSAALAGRLDGRNDPDGSLERGLDYPQQFRLIAEMDQRLRAAVPATRILIDFTGLDDISAVRARDVAPEPQDTCLPDDTTDLLTRGDVGEWSWQRWTIANAALVGLDVVGENPGPPDSAFTGGEDGSDDLAEQLPRAITYAVDCGLDRFFFAFEDELFDGGSEVDLEDYARHIAEARGGRADRDGT